MFPPWILLSQLLYFANTICGRTLTRGPLKEDQFTSSGSNKIHASLYQSAGVYIDPKEDIYVSTGHLHIPIIVSVWSTLDTKKIDNMIQECRNSTGFDLEQFVTDVLIRHFDYNRYGMISEAGSLSSISERLNNEHLLMKTTISNIRRENSTIKGDIPMIGKGSRKSKSKREIVTLTMATIALSGLAVTALGLYNSYEGVKVRDLANDLESRMDTLSLQFLNISSNLENQIQNIDDIYLYVSNLREYLSNVARISDCKFLAINAQIEYITTRVAIEVNSLVRGINSLYKNELNSDMMPLSRFGQLILNLPQLHNTIYTSYPETIYKVAKTSLAKLNMKEMTVSYILSVPLISASKIGTSFNLIKFPVIIKDKLFIVRENTRRYMMVDNVHQVYPLDMTSCIDVSVFKICDVRDISYKNNICLKTLLVKESLSDCKFKLADTEYPIVQYVSTGCLVSITSESNLTLSTGSSLTNNGFLHQIYHKGHSIIHVPYTSGDGILVDGEYYKFPSILNHPSIRISQVNVSHYSHTDYPGLIPSVPIKHKSSGSIIYGNFRESTPTVYVIESVLIFSGIFACCLFMWIISNFIKSYLERRSPKA
ncbi:glycoprotein [Strepsipteran arli-related virus OKIAV104]|uniref:Glycoprotein n=1 Tax=Strepsipteran arli-related virus OKIAV104 TaxID=2746355 RepID=A0AAE7IGD8_9MONO|nr:glycoprotein [Strepsipteran arli-related virus OKIAV104]QMP82290.1 glycoprotein [Strepsipteran arli-related virus OKIAV104]